MSEASKELLRHVDLYCHAHERLLQARARGDRRDIIECVSNEARSWNELLDACLAYAQRAGRGVGAATA